MDTMAPSRLSCNFLGLLVASIITKVLEAAEGGYDHQQHSLRRLLSQAGNVSTPHHDEEPYPTDPRVFWSVNGFIMVLLVTICSWYWCFGGMKRLTEATSDSDLEYARRLQRRNEEREKRLTMTPQERHRAIVRSLERNQVRMVVKEDDFVKPEDSKIFLDETLRQDITEIPETIPEADENNEEHQIVFTIGSGSQGGSSRHLTDLDCDSDDDIEGGGTNSDDEADWDATTASNMYGNLILRTEAGARAGEVPNQCAICLGCYEVGDAVVWSVNPDCTHAFHDECLVDWLVHSKQDGTPCPCCRQAFTDLRTFRKERKVRWEAGNTFNPQMVSFR